MSTVTREIRIDAPTERVWRHISDPDERRRWLGGDLDVDLTPGRRGRFAAPDDGARPVHVDDVDAGRSITFTWGEDDDASRVHIEVEPDGDGSRVRVTESTDAEAQGVPSTDGDEPVAMLVPLPAAARDEDDDPDLDRVGDPWAPGAGGCAPPTPIARAA